MKALALMALLVPNFAFAAPRPVPGSPMEHRLSCQFTQPIAGVGYALKVVTQALAPQHNVRGISLLSRVVYPGAPLSETKLTQIEQDVASAVFGSDEPKVRVELDKSNYHAKIYFDGQLTLLCKP